MTDIVIGILQADIEALEHLYTFRGRTEILQFLDKYPFLVPVLLEAPEKIRNCFPNPSCFWKLCQMLKSSTGYLVLSILMKLEPDDAVDKLNQMDMEWWIHTPYEVRKNVCTILEYPDEF